MNNLWNRSVGPFDEAAAQRHRHMGMLDCNGDVNADAVNFLAHLCAGLFFDALCDSYVEMQTVSRICQAFCKSENVEAQRVVLMICSEYSHVEAQCFAVYPAVAGGADNLRYIQVHATTEGGTNITGITTLDERASAPSSLTLKDGYLNESTVVFEFRGGTSAAAYADVAYDAK